MSGGIGAAGGVGGAGGPPRIGAATPRALPAGDALQRLAGDDAVRAAAAAEAIAPVAPVGSDRGTAAPAAAPPLPELLRRADRFVARAGATAPDVALALEAARGALVRGDGAAILAALDGAWAGAARTEDGWFLRASALLLAGRPREAADAAEAGRARVPSSAALPFARAAALLVGGDHTAARAALADARRAAWAPAGAPEFEALDAVITARAGDPETALDRLARRMRGARRDTPVLAWAQRTIAAGRRDAARADAVRDTAPATPAPANARAADPLDGAMRTLGARLASGSTRATPDAGASLEALLRALSAGGALTGAAHPERVQAARRIGVAVRGLLAGGGTWRDGEVAPRDAAQPESLPRGHDRTSDARGSDASAVTLTRVLAAIVRGDVWEAGVRLRRAALPTAERTLLGALLDGLAIGTSGGAADDVSAAAPRAADEATARRAASGHAASGHAASGHAVPDEAAVEDAIADAIADAVDRAGRAVVGSISDGPAHPTGEQDAVRYGLALLADPSPRAATERAGLARGTRDGVAFGGDGTDPAAPLASLDDDGRLRVRPPDAPVASGGAAAATLPLLALLAVALGLLAIASGHAAWWLAVGVAAAAWWWTRAAGARTR